MTSEQLRSDIAARRPDLRIDWVGHLGPDRPLEAVCTSTQTGRQAIWPGCWADVPPRSVVRVPAVVATPVAPAVARTVQRGLFE